MKYYIIAGEPSGDKHGAKIVKELLAKQSSSTFTFWGGDEMTHVLNQSPVVHVKDLAFMGFLEVLKNIFTIKKYFTKAKEDITSYNPDVILFIDYPGFNLRMAKWAKQKGFKTIYYISPTVWAWHKSRVYNIEKYVDLLICILPFEIDFYKDYKVNAVYLGNPIVDEVKSFNKDENFLQRHKIIKPIIALLPGSRRQEIQLILPTMIEASSKYSENYEIIIAKASNLPIEMYQSMIGSTSNIKLMENEYFNILAYAKAAIVTSGTATLETALFGVPQVVCYKTSKISYFIAKRLVSLKFISLVNLIAQKELVKELIQDDCNANQLSLDLDKILSLDHQIYSDLYEKLGESNSASKIAEKIIEYNFKNHKA